MKKLEKIKGMYSNLGGMVELANACDKAYADGIGKPECHQDFGKERSEMVAMNLAAISAVVGGVPIIALMRGSSCGSEMGHAFGIILRDVIDESLSEMEEQVLLRMANATWNAGQPFRDLAKNPLGRVKNMNVFDLLPSEEVEKDFHQIKTAASYLLGILEKE